MSKFMYEGVNVFNPIEDKMDYFINAFSKVLGENYRSIITERLSSASYLFVTDDDYSRMCRCYSAKLNCDINSKVNKYLKDNKLIHAKNVLHGMFKTDENLYSLCNKDDEVLNGIKVILNRAGFINSSTRKSVLSFLDDKSNIELFFDYYNSIINDIKKIKKDCYETYKLEIELLSDVAEIVDTRKRELLEYRFNFAKEELEDICLRNNLSFDKNKLDEMTYVFLDLLKLGEKSTIYNYKDFTKFHKKRLCELFKFMGFGERSNLKKYLEDKDVIKKAFGKEDFYNFIQEMQRLNLAESDEFYKVLKGKIENFATNTNSDARGMLFYFNSFFYEASNVEAYAWSKPTINGRKSMCVCRNALRLSSAAIIHEMGHILEGGFFDKQGLKIKNGNGQYDFHMMNEIFNEYLSLKVNKEFEKYNIKVGFLNGSKSAYTPALKIFEGFLEKYEKELIGFKISDSKEDYIKFFGTENLQKLDKIADTIVKKYGEKLIAEDDGLTICQAKNEVNKIYKDILELHKNNSKRTCVEKITEKERV